MYGVVHSDPFAARPQARERRLPAALFTAGVLVFAAVVTSAALAAVVGPFAAGMLGALAAAVPPPG